MDDQIPDHPVVYIVDDDASVGRALERLLRSHGLGSRAFGSAAELLKDDGWRDAACFLIDVQMPRMSGFELAESLVAAGTTMPVILMSAHAETSDLGPVAVALLSKPLDERLLLQTLLQAMAASADRRIGRVN